MLLLLVPLARAQNSAREFHRALTSTSAVQQSVSSSLVPGGSSHAVCPVAAMVEELPLWFHPILSKGGPWEELFMSQPAFENWARRFPLDGKPTMLSAGGSQGSGGGSSSSSSSSSQSSSGAPGSAGGAATSGTGDAAFQVANGSTFHTVMLQQLARMPPGVRSSAAGELARAYPQLDFSSVGGPGGGGGGGGEGGAGGGAGGGADGGAGAAFVAAPPIPPVAPAAAPIVAAAAAPPPPAAAAAHQPPLLTGSSVFLPGANPVGALAAPAAPAAPAASSKECAVCFDAIDGQGGRLACTVAPCGHTQLCLVCANRSWQTTRTCPMCKTQMVIAPIRTFG